MTSLAIESPPTGWSAFLGALSVRAIATVAGLALVAAAMLSPIFVIPFATLLGRVMFVAGVLLLAFAAARAWPGAWGLRWLPRGVAPVVAVCLAAPLATAIVYAFATGGSLRAFVDVPERISGFVSIAGSAIFFGLLAAIGATVRERLAQAKALALQLELERSRLERQALDARLSLLQAQVEPHFLFNTLANVQALVESQSPRAAEVLKSLIAYLRAALPRLHDGQPTLGNEIALVRAYLELMQMRMPDRLSFTIAVAPGLDARRFPPMALLTLVENAVRHGIDPAEDGGRIDVGAAEVPGALRLWVADSGVGLDPRAQPGTGLANLRARLQAFFGPTATLELSEQPPHGVRAEISLPT